MMRSLLCPLFCTLFLPLLATAQEVSTLPRMAHRSDFIQDILANVSDSAIAADVRHLESYGTRYAQFSHRSDIAEWIRQRFTDVGVADVDTVGFMETSQFTWQRNVVATIPGSAAGREELIIGAHYDSQSSSVLVAPGADDNASGTAGIIEMARVLRLANYQPRATIRFVAFAAEELGLHGGYDYAEKAFLSGDNIILMQNYDMIGYRDQSQADRHVAINQYQSALQEAELMSVLIQTYTTLTPHKTSVNITRSDSWPFALRFFKAVFVIEDENDFNPRYHTPRDSSIYLDFTYAAEIVQAGLALTLTVDAGITNTEEPERERPSNWNLWQNYPNPFNPSTEIRYTLPTSGHVRLWVHTLLGKNIAVLEHGRHPAGTHSVRWVPDVPTGVYYYTLEVVPEGDVGGAYRDTKKMMLIR